MEYRRFGNKLVMRLNIGDELCSCVMQLAASENVTLASVSAIGATNDATLGIFNTTTKEYFKQRYNACDYELASVTGNLSRKDGEPYLHLHAVVGNPQTGECHGGHLNEAVISATAEVIVDVIDGEVGRKFSDEIGLNLFEF